VQDIVLHLAILKDWSQVVNTINWLWV